MNYLWRVMRNLSGILGAILALGAVGNMDYYTIELGKSEPASTWVVLIVGMVMLLPSFVHALREY